MNKKPFTTDTFQQKVNRIANEQQREARNLKFNWIVKAGESRYQRFDYIMGLEEMIIKAVRPQRAPDNARN